MHLTLTAVTTKIPLVMFFLSVWTLFEATPCVQLAGGFRYYVYGRRSLCVRTDLVVLCVSRYLKRTVFTWNFVCVLLSIEGGYVQFSWDSTSRAQWGRTITKTYFYSTYHTWVVVVVCCVHEMLYYAGSRRTKTQLSKLSREQIKLLLGTSNL